MKTAILSFVVGSALAWTGNAWGQTHKVATSPDRVVRAVGVYEWTGDLAKPTGTRFVPVTVFINGELEDAGVYKPQPVPFALLAGNIYELDDAGLSKGMLVLESALHAKTPDGAPGPAFDAGWTAYGTFKAPAAPKRSTASTLKPSKVLPVIQTSGENSGKPHLGNKTGDTTTKDSTTSQQPQQGSNPENSDTAKNPPAAGADDPDRPTMHRRTASDDTATDSSRDSEKTTAASNDDAERPTLKRRSPEEEKEAQQSEKDRRKKSESASVTGGGSLNDDPDRPRLHHGDDSKDDTEAPKLMGVPKDMRQMVAVSDAKDRDPHPFSRPWESPNERAGVLAKMQVLARAKLAEYGVVPGVTPVNAVAGTTPATSTTASPTPNVTSDAGPPTLKRGIPSKASVTTEGTTTPARTAKTTSPAKTKPAATRTTSKTRHKTAAEAPVTLADEDLRGYTLSYGGAATYVYMAHTVETDSVMRYVTIVAQADAMGNLKLALASATDAAHLDRTPWMRLIDVVDVEASNRASLLFEMRGQSSRQFALYRVIAAKPEQIFLSGSAM